MSSLSEKLQEVLRAAGYSVTKPRQAVFDALQTHEPQTMGELARACQPAVNRASVYRVVQLFEQLGIVQRLQMGWKYKLELSDKFSQHHHHLTCTNCGATLDVEEDAALEARIHLLARLHGFMPEEHQLEISGLCPACQKSEAST